MLTVRTVASLVVVYGINALRTLKMVSSLRTIFPRFLGRAISVIFRDSLEVTRTITAFLSMACATLVTHSGVQIRTFLGPGPL